MLNNIGNLKDELLVRAGITTTVSGLYTDTILNGWLDPAHRWAAGFHKWPFTEVRDKTLSFSTEEVAYSSFSVNFKTDSIRILQVGGYLLEKLNFEDYQIFKESEPTGDDRVFSDFGRTVFINPYIDVSGTVTAWGQYTPGQFDYTDLTATTIFSNNEDEGNEAILQEMLSYAKTREQKKDEALEHHQMATDILERLWKRIQDEQAMYKTHPDRGGMWKRIDILKGSTSDELLHRDQF